MFPNNFLQSFHLLEKEKGNVFLTWSYPSVTNDVRNILLTKCFKFVKTEAFYILRKNSNWFYFKQFLIDNKTFSLVVVANKYEHKRCKLLCEALVQEFLKNKNPVALVKLYLNNFIRYFERNGKQGLLHIERNYSISDTNLKEFISSFGPEIILIYTAILLKRRILVYHKNVEFLQQALLPFTKLIISRNITEHTYPLVEDLQAELKGHSFYLAGTTSSESVEYTSLFDIHVNVAEKEILISPLSKDIFVMTKTQKEIAQFLVKLSQGELKEWEIIEEISNKSNELLKQLTMLSSITNENGKPLITIENFKEKKFNPALERFLCNLALSENMMIL